MSLHLGSSKITCSAFEGVILPKLEELRLDGCWDLTDTGVQKVLTNYCSTLKILHLSFTKITDAAFKGVNLPKLVKLSLTDCCNLTDKGVKRVLTTSGSS